MRPSDFEVILWALGQAKSLVEIKRLWHGGPNGHSMLNHCLLFIAIQKSYMEITQNIHTCKHNFPLFLYKLQHYLKGLSSNYMLMNVTVCLVLLLCQTYSMHRTKQWYQHTFHFEQNIFVGTFKYSCTFLLKATTLIMHEVWGSNLMNPFLVKSIV